VIVIYPWVSQQLEKQQEIIQWWEPLLWVLVPKRRGTKAGLSVLISDIQDSLNDRTGRKNDVLAMLTSTGSFDATTVAVGFECRFKRVLVVVLIVAEDDHIRFDPFDRYEDILGMTQNRFVHDCQGVDHLAALNCRENWVGFVRNVRFPRDNNVQFVSLRRGLLKIVDVPGV
jgi:hypothetical protein